MPDTNPHLQTPLSVFGAPAGKARLAVMLVHGRGQSPALMHEMLVSRIGQPDLAWFAPQAADSTWYPERFIEPLEVNEPRLSQGLERLDALSEQLRMMGFPYASQVLMGFSQGACLCSEFAWRQRRRYGALVAFTGGLIGPQGMPRDTSHRDLQGMPVLLSTWEQDPHVPASSVRSAADLFRAVGADVQLKVEAGTEHGIRDAEIAYARATLSRCLPTIY
jgi:phospholipase/carboxylesterase